MIRVMYFDTIANKYVLCPSHAQCILTVRGKEGICEDNYLVDQGGEEKSIGIALTEDEFFDENLNNMKVNYILGKTKCKIKKMRYISLSPTKFDAYVEASGLKSVGG